MKLRNEGFWHWYSVLSNRYGEKEMGCLERVGEAIRYGGTIYAIYIHVQDTRNMYSVKETYKMLMEGLISVPNQSWSKAWHKSIPLKVVCLAWRLFQNKIATKDNLFRRGVVGQGSLQCVGDCGVKESVSRPFFLVSGFGS